MMKPLSRCGLVIAFLVPIVSLMLLAGYHHWQRSHGVTVTLPIHGYDPRNLLSGHYVIYRIDYGIAQPNCTQRQPAVMCLQYQENRWQGELLLGAATTTVHCPVFIRGFCQSRQFIADIERFYIPERYATALDKAVRSDQGQIILQVSASGNAVVKDLYINGQSWRTIVDGLSR